jgi:2-furoyl-CoA dehydrogenase FAD binding subunit
LKPARFDYLRAGTLAEAHATLASEGEDARVLAGGQSLVPMLSMRMARPKVLVDIMHLPQLAKIENDGNTIRIGAGVRQAKLLAWPALPEHQPLLAAALPWVGHAQNPQPRDGLRLGRPRRSECRNSARPARTQRCNPLVVTAKAAARSGC